LSKDFEHICNVFIVAEDNTAIRNHTCKLLLKKGIPFVALENGLQAVQYIDLYFDPQNLCSDCSNTPMFLLDNQMPFYSGVEISYYL